MQPNLFVTECLAISVKMHMVVPQEKALAHFILQTSEGLQVGHWTCMSIGSWDKCNVYLQPRSLAKLVHGCKVSALYPVWSKPRILNSTTASQD